MIHQQHHLRVHWRENDTNVSVSKGPLAVAQDRMAAASAAESGFPQ
jgi:hypothetical protein